MSAFIPDQLDQMSKKDLLEFAQTAHEENVKLSAELKRESMELRSRLGAALGRNSDYNAAIENMQQQLAKANERVKELENEVKRLTDCVIHYGDKQANGKSLNKFAIEKKVEGAILFASSVNETGQFGWSDCQWLSDFAEEWAEQLRKEQEK